MRSTRLGLGVALLGTLFSLQLLWWGLLLWRQADRWHEARYLALLERRDRAQEAWRERSAELGDGAAAWRELAASFPGLAYIPGSEPPIQPSGDELRGLDEARERHRVMVLGEGSLFVVLTASALWLLLRAVRREAYLTLQHAHFLHAVTHEFRTPLQSLRLAVESLLRRPDPARARGYGEGMLEDIGRLEGLVENVLAVGRLDAAAFRTDPRRMDLSAAVEQCLQRIRGDGAEAAWLQTEVRPGVWAEADAATLEPILRNLLDNGRKYGEGRPVKVRLDREGDQAVLRVADQGRGFTAEERSHLFERFWRAGDERVRTAPGVGLGLYLVRELARAQSATIEAHSAGLGRGAEFVLRWPGAGPA